MKTDLGMLTCIFILAIMESNLSMPSQLKMSVAQQQKCMQQLQQLASAQPPQPQPLQQLPPYPPWCIWAHMARLIIGICWHLTIRIRQECGIALPGECSNEKHHSLNIILSFIPPRIFNSSSFFYILHHSSLHKWMNKVKKWEGT